ncbi:helix-turn-helix domain-containing protein [Streptomyces wedmorensis]|uniref:helix-turn-helix domain-containing protein n=1 Tax=Streptomyces wedmorensis TaxID=43759 RepID=UPI003797A9C9
MGGLATLTSASRLGRPAVPGVPVRVIAAQRGFSHASAFSRAFRDSYGISPGAFRRLTPEVAVVDVGGDGRPPASGAEGRHARPRRG